VAVLRGPLFGASDRELFAYRQDGGWFSIFAKDFRGAPRVVEAALATLHQYYRWTRVLPLASALDRILEHSGYLALAATTAGGVEAGDLLHAIDRVRQVVEEGGSLTDAGDALDEDAEETSEVESLPLEPGRTDVVRIMNLHKAKGLEADVVFLADPCGGFNPRVDVHISRTGTTSQGWFRVVKKSERSYAFKVLGEHADWPMHEAAELPYLEHEQNRLLYVAATRARQVLVVSRWSGNAKIPAWGVLNDFLVDAPELRVSTKVHVAQPVAADCSSAAQADALGARGAAHVRLREPTWSITSVTAEARHVARMVRQSDPAPDDPTGVVGSDTPTHRADAGMAWGTLIHGLLEHAMRHPNATRDDLKRLAMWLTVEEPQLRAVIGEAVETVRIVTDEGFWRAAQLGEHLTEAPFVVAEDHATLRSGVVDLVFKADGAWAIRDYKTDFTLKPDAYRQQLDAYTSALRRLGIDVGEASIVQVRQNDAYPE
jgi:ATP-dependent helicase/nuclease subunit A